MSVDSLQVLSCAQFLFTRFGDTSITLTRNDPSDLTRPKPKLTFDLPPTSQILRASHPLWMYRICETVKERISQELHAWLNNYFCFPEVVNFPVEIETYFRMIVWKNLQLDAAKTALQLLKVPSLIVDYRLVIAVHFGWLDIAKEISQSNLESDFAHLNAINDYRRVALGFLTPSDLVLTPSNHIRPLPMSFLRLVPPERLLQANFMEALQRLLCEVIWDVSDDNFPYTYLNKFLQESKRDLSRVGPIMFSTLIATFCHSTHRCEKLLKLAATLLGTQAAVDTLLEQWGVPGQGRATIPDGMTDILLHACRHPRVTDCLLRRLQTRSPHFSLSHDCLLTLAQRNDSAMCALIETMAIEACNPISTENVQAPTNDAVAGQFDLQTLWRILAHNGFELFHSICYCNAWRSLNRLATIFQGRRDEFVFGKETADESEKDQPQDCWALLATCRDFGCIFAACKRGNFLIVERLTRDMSKCTWRRFFAHKRYEAFYTVCKMNFTALVEWFGLMCDKYDEMRLYEEAHLFTVHLLEVEAKSLQHALEALRLEQTSHEQ